MGWNGRVAARGWRWSIVAGAVLAMGLVVVPAAQAKVPSRGPEKTVGCANGKKAKIWWQGTTVVEDHGDHIDKDWTLTQFAVDNRCQQWLSFTIMSDPHSGGDCCYRVQVAPGANFTKKDAVSTALFSGYGSAPFFVVRETAHECVDSNGYGPQYDVAKDGKVTSTGKCPRKYPESDFRTIACSGSWDPDRGDWAERVGGVWKVDGKKIIKLAATNPCEYEMLFWWRTNDGRRIALWVDEHLSFDFWKAELGKLPVNTKDGKVHFIHGPRMGPTTEDTAAYDENWRIDKDRPYLWVD